MTENKVIKNRIEINGYEMRYARFGSGKQTVVIIPGLNLGSVVDSADAVALQYKIIADRFTVYLFDRKNISDSKYSVYDMASETVGMDIRALCFEKNDRLPKLRTAWFFILSGVFSAVFGAARGGSQDGCAGSRSAG